MAIPPGHMYKTVNTNMANPMLSHMCENLKKEREELMKVIDKNSQLCNVILWKLWQS